MNEGQAWMSVPLTGGAPRAEVSVGYKRTDAGVMPEDWDAASLGEVADIRSGATPSTRVSANWDGSISWCTPTDITNTPGKYLTETERSITEKGLSDCAASLLPAGALLLCSRATIGEIKIASSPVCTNQGFKSLVCAEQAHNEFLYYLILTLKPRLIRKAIGSTFLEIGKQALASIEIRLPPLKEQRSIAVALSDVDRLLESLESLIAKKRAIKYSAMQQLMTGKMRLPGFNVEWRPMRLGELGSFLKGRGIKREDISSTGFPCIRYGELYTRYENYILNIHTRIPSSIAKTALPIKKGDLLFAGSGETSEEIGRCAAYLGDEPVYAGGDVLVLTPFGQNSLYLGYLMNYPTVAEQKARMGQGDAVVHVNTRSLAQIEVDLPPVDEQTAIAAVLFDMDTEIAALERQLGKTRALKEGMMQQLLAGAIRLVAEEAATSRDAAKASAGRGHGWQFNEAVVISVLAKQFGNDRFPLGRMRYTKLSYLLHRYHEGKAEGYLKKAAGPYNPRTRYGGSEKIALKKDYMRRHESVNYQGFIAGENIQEAEGYFAKWYGEDSLKWLDRFRYEKNDGLELLTTVDLAAEELREAGKDISAESVKEAIRSVPEWKAKLKRSIFSDTNIIRAIERSRKLFGPGDQRPKP